MSHKAIVSSFHINHHKNLQFHPFPDSKNEIEYLENHE